MGNLIFLNSKTVKGFYKILKEQFGISDRLDLALVITEKNNIFAISRSVDLISLDNLRLNTIGIYIGELKETSFRPSIEGSQLLAPLSSKNVLEVNDKIAKMWLYGLDIPSKEFEGIVMVKSKRDFLGSGIYKNGRILNHVPKGRRIHE